MRARPYRVSRWPGRVAVTFQPIRRPDTLTTHRHAACRPDPPEAAVTFQPIRRPDTLTSHRHPACRPDGPGGYSAARSRPLIRIPEFTLYFRLIEISTAVSGSS